MVSVLACCIASKPHLPSPITRPYCKATVTDEIPPAVGGIPGGGKSTLAYPLTSAVNALHRRRGGNGDVAVCIGVDGWHYSQTAMRSMPVSVNHTDASHNLQSERDKRRLLESSHLATGPDVPALLVTCLQKVASHLGRLFVCELRTHHHPHPYSDSPLLRTRPGSSLAEAHTLPLTARRSPALSDSSTHGHPCHSQHSRTQTRTRCPMAARSWRTSGSCGYLVELID